MMPSERTSWSAGGILLLLATACGQPPVPPATATLATDTTLRAPDGSAVPDGPLGISIRRGHALLAATADSLPAHVGNALRCTSCHLDDGRRPNAMPLTGVFVRYPAYSSRSASIQTIEDRINGCFRRSMNGSALDPEDPAMRDMVAYLAFISRGIAVGDTVPGQGVPKVQALSGDTVAGATLFLAKCARCHGVDGNGTSAPATTTAPAITYPPLWGPRSFNIGAGMTRFRTAAGFIHVNMPFDQPGTLSEEEALNIAAYVVSRERPDFPGKERDWPRGDAPADAAYPTLAGRGGTAPH